MNARCPQPASEALHGGRFIQDCSALLRLVLFNYLMDNCDAHAKNYSDLQGVSGVRLAPAYDPLSTVVYDWKFGSELSRGMGMRIGEHSNIDRVTREDFELLGKRMGLLKRHI